MKAFRHFLFLFLLATVLLLPLFTFGQQSDHKNKKEKDTTKTTSPNPPVPRLNSHSGERERLFRAINTVCSERKYDPFGSTPIDIMQTLPTMATDSKKSSDGLRRAERLLPLTKELVAQAMQELGKRHAISQQRIARAIDRIRLVNKIKPDPELRDNAAVIMSEPGTISFGTIFLAGLPSDEGMISVLAHEMTHLTDVPMGESTTLYPLFNIIGKNATKILGFRVAGQRAEELTCDLIGVMVTRYYIERSPNRDTLSRRLSRSLQHNCVEQDETDDDHLTPRHTMRAIMGLDPTLAPDLLGITASAVNQEVNNNFIFKIERGTSLTISRPSSYHHRSQ